MRLATRLFASIALLVAAAVVGSIIATDLLLRRYLEAEIAVELEREARLLAVLTPADSSKWPEFAALTGGRLGRRVTLIDPEGHVRGDTEFDRASLSRLQNHRDRPEVRAALDSASGVGMDQRLSASTNERQMYVAVRGGPPGLAVVRVSTTLATVDAQVHAWQRAVAAAGLTEPQLLARLRRAMLGDPDRFVEIADRLAAAGSPISSDDALTRLPRGFEAAKGTPVADYVCWKSFTTHAALSNKDMQSPAVVDRIVEFARAALPLLEWGWVAAEDDPPPLVIPMTTRPLPPPDF